MQPQISRQERFSVLSLQLKTSHGVEKLEIIFPSDDENTVSKGIEQMLLYRGLANQTIKKN